MGAAGLAGAEGSSTDVIRSMGTAFALLLVTNLFTAPASAETVTAVYEGLETQRVAELYRNDLGLQS